MSGNNCINYLCVESQLGCDLKTLVNFSGA